MATWRTAGSRRGSVRQRIRGVRMMDDRNREGTQGGFARHRRERAVETLRSGEEKKEWRLYTQ
ncbi:hypothetical protein SESBI_18562 [Sesbania bispinosa]|nr:hypothetical protein SESBI_18562 [Sesbania bispinosa]